VTGAGNVDQGVAHRRVALLLAARPSPIADGLPRLARALADVVPAGWSVATSVRDAPWAIGDAVRGLVAAGVDELVVVSMHPQFAPDTTGVIADDLYAALRDAAPHLNVTVRASWHDDAGYVNAIARWIAEHPTARAPMDAELRFVVPAEGAPQGLHATQQARHTAELVVRRLGWPADGWTIVPTHPDPESASEDHERVLICPLPFPWAAAEPPRPLVDALRGLLLHGTRPATGEPAAPLLAPADGDLRTMERATLVMIGASLANGIGPGRGPAIRHSELRAFAQVKRSRKALRACLDQIREDTPLAEAFIWNTCQRIELYGWMPAGYDAHDRACLIADLRRALFGTEPEGLEVNVLEAMAARHHLLRTACGLNSGLPGDRDVAAQLQTACRTAQCSRTAGPRSTALVDEALALAREVHAHTAWGHFSTGFCAAALARICEVDGVRPDRFRHVVIGGSTTSRSILSTLAAEHGVPHRQMTLIYRDHHGQMKQLRAALGTGRRLRVHTYGEDAVLRAIADADFVYFGMDQAEPVLDAAALLDLRDYGARPLTVVDFNSFGSIADRARLGGITYWSATELDAAVAAQAAVTITRSGFAQAADEVEREILDHQTSASCNGVPSSRQDHVIT